MTEEAGGTGGLLDSLRNLASTFVAVLHTRLEIVASEFEEERARIARIAVLAAVCGFCLALAVNLLVFFLVVLFWDTNRLVVIGVLAAVFAIGGIAAGMAVRAAMARRPRLLSTTLAELRKDHNELSRR